MTENPKVMVAGPWVGEFGWELMIWQSHIRFLAKSHKYNHIIIGCKKGHEAIYEDFAHEFLPCPVSSKIEGWRVDGHDPHLNGHHVKKIKEKYGKEFAIVTPSRKTTSKKNKRIFVKYGTPNKKLKYDLLFCCRNVRRYCTQNRNWPDSKWNSVRSHFRNLRIGCIGSKKESKHMAHTDDLRGIPLKNIFDIMASSRLVIGPSSGSMHMASLCGCPHLVWTNKAKWGSINGTNRQRYEHLWNPLRTPVWVIDDCNWQPNTVAVINMIEKILS